MEAPAATPVALAPALPEGWRDLGGYQLALTPHNGTPPATGWRTTVCSTFNGTSVTYLPGMVASGTFLLFKLSRVSLANFERYWALTSGAPSIPASTTVVDRMPNDVRSSQTIAITRDNDLVSGSVWVGGFSGCYQRTSASALLASSYDFNATPGSGVAAAGDGRPYVTELCNTRDFAFIEVYVP